MTDDALLGQVEAAFGAVARPRHFHDDLDDPEAADHDTLLRSRNRGSLTIEDVGNMGWDPFVDCLPQGLAFYFPTLIRFALRPAVPTSWDSYAIQLVFHLSNNNRFLDYCDPAQRAAVAAFLAHMVETRADMLGEAGSLQEFVDCLARWRAQPPK